jgi:c(7)-type cytochrome triheme protein
MTPAAAVVLAFAAGQSWGPSPMLLESAEPHVYGRVVLDNFSTKAGMAPVPFEHARHRLLYTCRVCHVDVGFVMEAGATEISAETNRRGLHCGACHDGKRRNGDGTIFAACSDPGARPAPPACARCHRRDTDAELRERFERFARTAPVDRTGFVDWEALEARTRPADFLEGVTAHADRLRNDRSFSIPAFGTWLGEVTFSHPKHARWSGCEGCHPEVFPVTARGAVTFRMPDFVAGRYCGACHNKVAFPLAACLRCHANAIGALPR